MRASRVRVGRSPRANLHPSWAGGEKTPLGAPPSQENIVTSQSVPRPSSRTWGHRIVEILDGFDTLTNSISWGLPKESALRRKLYEYYRDALLGFPHRRPRPKGQPSRLLLPYKKHIKTIPTDNRPEFAAYKLITKYLGVVVYFADPYVSCQKGAIKIQTHQTVYSQTSQLR